MTRLAVTPILEVNILEILIKGLDTVRQLPISIIMGDINGLKLINDGFGHSKGDEVLIEIAKILKIAAGRKILFQESEETSLEFYFPEQDSQSAQIENLYRKKKISK